MLVVIGMFLNVPNFENCSRIQVRKHVFTNTQLRKFSRMTRPISGWNSIISRTGMLWNGKHRTNTWSHSDRIRNSAKSKRSNIRWKIHRVVFDHWRKMVRTSALPLHNNLFTIPGSFSGTRFSKPSPACNASSFLLKTSRERERINSLWIQELHFVWW